MTRNLISIKGMMCMIDPIQVVALAFMCLGGQKSHYRQTRMRADEITFAIYGPSGDSVIFPATKIGIEAGESVLDVSLKVLKQYKIQFEASGVGSATYIKGIDDLYQFDEGPQSGWLFKVNDTFPEEGSGAYEVKSGDTVQWVYTVNLGKDVGATINNLTRSNNYMPPTNNMRRRNK